MPGNAGQRVLPAEQARNARGEEVVGRALGFEKTAQLAPAEIGEHFAVALVQVVFPPHGRGRCEASRVGVVAQDQRQIAQRVFDAALLVHLQLFLPVFVLRRLCFLSIQIAKLLRGLLPAFLTERAARGLVLRVVSFFTKVACREIG